MEEKNTIGRFVDVYEHEKARNPGTESRTKVGGFFKKMLTGSKAARIMEELDRARSSQSIEERRAQVALNENRITRAEYDQRCGMAKKRVAMLERKYGYLNDQQFEQRMAQIKNEHKYFYDPCVVRR